VARNSARVALASGVLGPVEEEDEEDEEDEKDDAGVGNKRSYAARMSFWLYWTHESK
jgi:hypothetical protein